MGRAELWSELMKLTADERLELVQDLWETIRSDSQPPLSDEDKNELDRRYADHLRDPSSALKWEDVKARLLARYK